MKTVKWIKDNVVAISIAMSNVQKVALGQQKESLGTGNNNQEKKQTQTNLLNALLNGEVNQEVKNLRWRTYLIIQASKGIKTNIIGWEKNEEGEDIPIISTVKQNYSDVLKKVKVDDYDSFKLEMVVRNDFESVGIQDLKVDSDDVISQLDFSIMSKAEQPITVERDSLPQFFIEVYSNKLNVRTIDNTNKLLEFYVSKYPDVNSRRSNLFISEIKKIIGGKRSGILDLNGVSFITYNTIGAPDFLQYRFLVDSFDKIIEYDGYYVIKFLATCDIDGINILEKYREESLDLEYHNKAQKKLTI